MYVWAPGGPILICWPDQPKQPASSEKGLHRPSKICVPMSHPEMKGRPTTGRVPLGFRGRHEAGNLNQHCFSSRNAQERSWLIRRKLSADRQISMGRRIMSIHPSIHPSPGQRGRRARKPNGRSPPFPAPLALLFTTIRLVG